MEKYSFSSTRQIHSSRGNWLLPIFICIEKQDSVQLNEFQWAKRTESSFCCGFSWLVCRTKKLQMYKFLNPRPEMKCLLISELYVISCVFFFCRCFSVEFLLLLKYEHSEDWIALLWRGLALLLNNKSTALLGYAQKVYPIALHSFIQIRCVMLWKNCHHRIPRSLLEKLSHRSINMSANIQNETGHVIFTSGQLNEILHKLYELLSLAVYTRIWFDMFSSVLHCIFFFSKNGRVSHAHRIYILSFSSTMKRNYYSKMREYRSRRFGQFLRSHLTHTINAQRLASLAASRHSSSVKHRTTQRQPASARGIHNNK